MLQCYNCIIIPSLHYKYPVLINTVPSYHQIDDVKSLFNMVYNNIQIYINTVNGISSSWIIICMKYLLLDVKQAAKSWHRLYLCSIYFGTWWGREVTCFDIGSAIILYHSLGTVVVVISMVIRFTTTFTISAYHH